MIGGKGLVFLFSDTQIVKEPVPRSSGISGLQLVFYFPESFYEAKGLILNVDN